MKVTLPLRIAVLTAWSVAIGALAETAESGAVFTVAQATRGQQVYGRVCIACHSSTLKGEKEAPALVGEAFVQKWEAFTLEEMYELIKATMPKDRPDSLPPSMVVDVMAYILAQNGYAAGENELPPEMEQLRDISIRHGQ